MYDDATVKTALLLVAALLSAACASSDGFIDETVHMCDPGDPISIEAGAETDDDSMTGPGEAIIPSRIVFRVRVSNNSRDEVEVRSIRVDQPTGGTPIFVFDNAQRQFKEVIPEGEDHTFEIPSTGKWSRRNTTSRAVEVNVTVGLANGDVYRCRFAV